MSIIWHALAAAAMLAAGGPALAGPLLIAPTTIEFAPGRRSAIVELTNQSAEAVTLQFRAFLWSQPDGRDLLAPATDLIVSPPIATVPAHAKQVFRILDSGGGGAASERSYRLKLNELPGVPTGDVRINVEFSLPVFITPAGAAPNLVVEGDGGSLRVANRGSRRLRITDLFVVDAAGAGRAVNELKGAYLLAGAARRVGGGGGQPNVRVTARTDAGLIDVPLATLAAR